MTQAQVAHRLGIKPQAYFEIEGRETRSTLSLGTLRRAASALDCELIYFLLPRRRGDGNSQTVSFGEVAREHDPEVGRMERTEHSMLLEDQAVEPRVDPKNIGLAKIIYGLRQDLGVHRMIGLNLERMQEVRVGAFFGHVQMRALEAIALGFCKIYEPEARYQLNSIDGVIQAMSDRPAPEALCRSAERFARKHGIGGVCRSLKPFLAEAVRDFTSRHAEPLRMLKEFRDKFGAHGESDFKPGSLPSHLEFEGLWEFAADLYRFISGEILDISPALMGLDVESSLARLLEHDLHIQPLMRDFP